VGHLRLRYFKIFNPFYNLIGMITLDEIGN
jgi:hypothetical protein